MECIGNCVFLFLRIDTSSCTRKSGHNRPWNWEEGEPLRKGSKVSDAQAQRADFTTAEIIMFLFHNFFFFN